MTQQRRNLTTSTRQTLTSCDSTVHSVVQQVHYRFKLSTSRTPCVKHNSREGGHGEALAEGGQRDLRSDPRPRVDRRLRQRYLCLRSHEGDGPEIMIMTTLPHRRLGGSAGLTTNRSVHCCVGGSKWIIPGVIRLPGMFNWKVHDSFLNNKSA